MVYLDYAATTPVLPEAAEAVLRAMEKDFGNPSSVHAYGRAARNSVEDSRDAVAAAVGASPSEIIFTGGGTEADNLALKGSVRPGDHVVVSAFEHDAVLEAAGGLERQGVEITLAPVGSDGIVDPAAVAAAVRPSTVLVSVMAVNNEIGTVQDPEALSEAARAVKGDVLVHTDAVQALGNIPVALNSWGADLASFSGHKLGGPKGVGALFVRSGVTLEPQLHGGGQERGLRSGTLNVPAICGFGVAAEIAAKEVYEKAERLAELRARLLDGIRSVTSDVVVNGSLERRIPGNLNVCLPGTDGETLLMLLDASGVACSSGSACASGALDPSHVLLAIGVPRALAAGSLRLSLGRGSSRDDVDAFLQALPEVIERARRGA
ncbi:MAG: cysteine desulfurase [Actinobacteria bacterium]|nr:cysteine desulfurase [Actinomycetota bacterium]